MVLLAIFFYRTIFSQIVRTVLGLRLSLSAVSGNLQVHQCSTLSGTQELDLPVHQLGTFAHRDQAYAPSGTALRQSRTVVFNLQFNRGK